MANEAFVYDQSYLAGADFSAKQFLFAKNSGTAQTAAVAGNGEKTIGAIQNKPASGQAASVRELGRSKLVVDGNAGAIAAGDFLGSNAAGKGIKVSADKAWVGARAEEASTVDGDIIEVTVQGFYLSV